MRNNWKNVVYVEGYVYNFSLFANVAGPNSKNPGQEYINGTVLSGRAVKRMRLIQF